MELPSFRNMFSTPAPAPQPVPPPAAGNTPPGPTPSPAPGNPPIPASGTGDPPAPDAGNSAVLDFQKLWNNPPTDPNAPAPAATGFLPEIPVAELQKAFSTMDFTRNIPPEQFAAIAQGGEAAQQAMGQIMNALARNVAMANYQATHKMVGAGLTKAVDSVQDALPGQVSAAISMNHLAEENPLMTNPAFSPLVRSVGEQILTLNPKFNAQQVRQETSRYFDEMSAAILAGKPAPAPTVRQRGDRKTSNDSGFTWDQWDAQ